MTISAAYTPQRYLGDAGDTVMNTVFPFFAKTDIVVTSFVILTGVGTVLTKDVHYSVLGGGLDGTQPSSTGTVTAINGSANFPTTVTWLIERATPVTQLTDYAENDSFPAVSHEGALDRVLMQRQESTGVPVLLAQASGVASSNLILDSADWTDLYDSVRLELHGVFPTSADRMHVKLRDNGSASTSGLTRVMSTIYGSGTATTLDQAGADWGTAGGVLVDNTLVAAVNGAITFHNRNEKLYGFGQYTYVESSTSTTCGVSCHFIAGGSYTRHDGFHIQAGGSTNLTGTARLFGLPRN